MIPSPTPLLGRPARHWPACRLPTSPGIIAFSDPGRATCVQVRRWLRTSRTDGASTGSHSRSPVAGIQIGRTGESSLCGGSAQAEGSAARASVSFSFETRWLRGTHLRRPRPGLPLQKPGRIRGTRHLPRPSIARRSPVMRNPRKHLLQGPQSVAACRFFLGLVSRSDMASPPDTCLHVRTSGSVRPRCASRRQTS